jgi:hypothetical protein
MVNPIGIRVHPNFAPVSTNGLCRAEQEERKYFRTEQALRPWEGASALLSSSVVQY